MRTYILLLVSFLWCWDMRAQEFTYFDCDGSTDHFFVLKPKDRPFSVLKKLGWKSSRFRDGDSNSIRAQEKSLFQKYFSNSSTEDIEILKEIDTLLFLDADLNILTSNTYLPKEYIEDFRNLEEVFHKYLSAHTDLNYLRPYLVLSEDFTGTAFRIRLRWVFE